MRYFNFLSLLLVIFVIYSCAPEKNFRQDPFTLTATIGSDPLTLNPVLSEDSYSGSIISHIYEGLLRRNPETLALEGLLAESWNISNDFITFTFRLRSDAVFSDGVRLTSRDVVFSFQKIMDPAVPNPHLKVYYENVKTISAPDDKTVVFTLKKPYFKSLEMLGGFEIIPRHIFSQVKNFVTDEHSIAKPIGSGPYILSEWKTGRKIVLGRNEKYWGKKPDIHQIQYRIIKNESVALQALKKQEIDTLNLRPFQYARQTSAPKFQKNFERHKYLAQVYRYIGYNLRREPFGDVRVRRAMAYALPLEEIRKSIFWNLAEPITGGFFLHSPQYNRSLQPIPYNPEKARTLLLEAGFKDSNNDGILDRNGKEFRFELLIPSSVMEYEQMAAVMRESLLRQGIDMEIRKLEFQVLIEKVNQRDFEALVLGWSTPVESDPYQLWHSSQLEKGHNFTGFTTSELDALIEAARGEPVDEKRNAMFRRIHEILYENQPYTFLFSPYNLVAVHKRFKNVVVYPGGLDQDRWIINPEF